MGQYQYDEEQLKRQDIARHVAQYPEQYLKADKFVFAHTDTQGQDPMLIAIDDEAWSCVGLLLTIQTFLIYCRNNVNIAHCHVVALCQHDKAEHVKQYLNEYPLLGNFEHRRTFVEAALKASAWETLTYFHDARFLCSGDMAYERGHFCVNGFSFVDYAHANAPRIVDLLLLNNHDPHAGFLKREIDIQKKETSFHMIQYGLLMQIERAESQAIVRAGKDQVRLNELYEHFTALKSYIEDRTELDLPIERRIETIKAKAVDLYTTIRHLHGSLGGDFSRITQLGDLMGRAVNELKDANAVQVEQYFERKTTLIQGRYDEIKGMTDRGMAPQGMRPLSRELTRGWFEQWINGYITKTEKRYKSLADIAAENLNSDDAGILRNWLETRMNTGVAQSIEKKVKFS